jgi:hypothetical protein
MLIAREFETEWWYYYVFLYLGVGPGPGVVLLRSIRLHSLH